jgi:hypothetical protein
MKFPVITVMGHDYTVVFDLDDGCGEVDTTKQNIRIDPDQHGDNLRKTLLHELIHTADRVAGTGDMTEAQVVAIENGLWAIFRDNKGLATAMFDGARA